MEARFFYGGMRTAGREDRWREMWQTKRPTALQAAEPEGNIPVAALTFL